MAYISFVGSDTVSSRGADRVSREAPVEASYCACAVMEDDVLVTADVIEDERTKAASRLRGDSTVISYAGALIKADDGSKIGTLCVVDDRRRALTPQQVDLLRGLARQAMNLVALRHAQRELAQALERMTVLATTDELTGCLNRRAFMEQAEGLRKLAARSHGTLSLAIIDLDHFKRINDTHGHAAGDEVLRRVGKALRDRFCSTDKVGRIGGEELGLVLPLTAGDDALRLVDALRQSIGALGMNLPGGAPRVTCSAGVAELRAGEESVQTAFRRADLALYAAKAAGRDQLRLG
jgi:diguanylate cyclase (GGDEF)-like protein